ncbi:MAG: CdaR family protein, partial [Pricia sp.]
KGASKKKMDVKLRAGGFTFLGFNFKKKKVEIDVSEAEKEGDRFFVPEKMYRTQIEKQLSASMSLLEIDNDTLFLDMMAVTTKKVPVKPRGTMDLAQNYLLDGKLGVTPDSISITGPPEEIDTISQVRTENTNLPDLTSDFTEEVALFKSPELKNTTYSENTAILSGKVVRFSERIIEVPIQIVNLPENLEIKTFPDKISVVCKAKTERLKKLKPSDFQITGDYETVKDGESNEMKLQLKKKPEALHSARLKTGEVEFIVKKK